MLAIYKNRHDYYKLHYGEILTNISIPDKIYIYLDVIPKGDIKTKKLDWKNSHIQSVNVEDIEFICDTEKTMELKLANLCI